MRLVSTDHLKDGDIIARDIISYEGGVLLRHDTRFKEAFKAKLIERNIPEVYIEDEISKGIEPTEIISSAAKQKVTLDIKKQFEEMQENLTLDVGSLTQTTNFLMSQLNHTETILELDDLKTNDQYTYDHCISVAILTNIVCNKMNLNIYQKESIVMGALIHDIGKIIIPKDILNKPDRLTDEEYEIVKSHAEVGYKMIKDNIELNALTKLAVLCHHEREDHRGYPLGKGKELHLGIKIVAACDLFHALISNRCYRQGLPINEAIAIAQSEAIDPEIRKVIEKSFAYYPVGCVVVLNSGELAIVEKNYSNDLKRPLIRIIDKKNKCLANTYKINLQDQERFYIVGRYDGKI